MTQVPASSHGGGGFPPANWTVDSDGNFIVAPPTTGGTSSHLEQLTTAELPADTTDVLRVYSTPAANALFVVDSSGEVLINSAHANSSGLSVRELQAGAQLLLNVAGNAGRAGKSVVFFTSGADALFQFGSGGLIVGALNAAPSDADLAAGQFALWYDQTNGASKLMVKAKQADGAVKTAAIALA